MSDRERAPTPSGAAPARSVCLVDDDPAVRKALTRLLQSAGFKVHAFEEPRSFLDHIATHPVPVLVSDIWMKGFNGMELLARLCAQSPRPRVIFITGQEDRAAETTVMQAGAFAFLIKPVEDEQFLATVRLAFGDLPANQ